MLLELAIIMLIIAIVLRQWVKRRRFYRTAGYRYLVFKNYRSSFVVYLEQLALWISFFMIVGALIFGASHFINKHTEKKARQEAVQPHK